MPAKQKLNPDAMNDFSNKVGENLTVFLVRQAADQERDIIRKEFKIRLSNVSKQSFLFDNSSNSNNMFTNWETALAQSSSLNLPKRKKLEMYEEALQGYYKGKANHERKSPGYSYTGHPPNKPDTGEIEMPTMLVKEAEGIWHDYEGYNGDLKTKEILKMSKFLARFEDSGYVVEDVNLQSGTIQKYYTTKAGYYKGRVCSAAYDYANIKQGYIEKMEKVNQWEMDALKASGVQLSQEAYQSEVVYDRILTAWEKMTNPVKIAALDSNDVDDQIVKCLEDNADVSCETNSSEKVLNENDVNVSHVEHADYAELNLEENEFLKLWDKYKNRLEVLLVHRQLNRYPKAQSCTCSADMAKSA